MILSNRSIRQAINVGLLKIEPFEVGLLHPCYVDLRLGNAMLEQHVKGVIDPLVENSMSCYREIRIDQGEPYVLKTGAFALATTYESIGISRNFAALVDGTSTVGRLGVPVTQRAMIIDPGHGWPKPRPIVLEMKNNGLNPVKLHYKMPVASMVVLRLDCAVEIGYDENGGKYSNGSILPIPIAMHKN